jgi:hypothetical protein
VTLANIAIFTIPAPRKSYRTISNKKKGKSCGPGWRGTSEIEEEAEITTRMRSRNVFSLLGFITHQVLLCPPDCPQTLWHGHYCKPKRMLWRVKCRVARWHIFIQKNPNMGVISKALEWTWYMYLFYGHLEDIWYMFRPICICIL